MADHGLVMAFSLNPLTWLGGAVAGGVGDVWKSAMVGLWSAGMWLLDLAFKIIDAFTTPDLSSGGPLAQVLPTTLWIGAAIVALTFTFQILLALLRGDGRSIGRVLFGVAQFGAVWVSFLAIAATLVIAFGGLTSALLSSMLHINTWSAFTENANSWPRNVSDTVGATVLGVTALLLIMPAAFAYLIIMLVRAAALILLVATAPIAAAGIVNETTKVWFWKMLRWFFASLAIAPAAALILGVGEQLSVGVIAGDGDKTLQSIGMAVIGAIVVAIGAVSPMLLFRLLSFVEPGTASGAALRQSFSDAGGIAGLASGGGQTGGLSAATQTGRDGRSLGESAAESQTQSRLSSMLGAAGQGIQTAARLANKAADIGVDVLGHGGVGHPGYSMGYADNESSRRTQSQQSGKDSKSPDSDPDGPGPQSPPSPVPGGPAGDGGTPQIPGGGVAGGEAGGAGAAGGAGVGEAAAAAVIAL